MLVKALSLVALLGIPASLLAAFACFIAGAVGPGLAFLLYFGLGVFYFWD